MEGVMDIEAGPELNRVFDDIIQTSIGLCNRVSMLKYHNEKVEFFGRNDKTLSDLCSNEQKLELENENLDHLQSEQYSNENNSSPSMGYMSNSEEFHLEEDSQSYEELNPKGMLIPPEGYTEIALENDFQSEIFRINNSYQGYMGDYDTQLSNSEENTLEDSQTYGESNPTKLLMSPEIFCSDGNPKNQICTKKEGLYYDLSNLQKYEKEKDELTRMNKAHFDAFSIPYGIALENDFQSQSFSMTFEQYCSPSMGYKPNSEEFILEDSQESNSTKMLMPPEGYPDSKNFHSDGNPKNFISTKKEGLYYDLSNVQKYEREKDEFMKMNKAHCDAFSTPYGKAVEDDFQSGSFRNTFERYSNEIISYPSMGYTGENTTYLSNSEEFILEGSQSYGEANPTKMLMSSDMNFYFDGNPKNLISTKKEGLNYHPSNVQKFEREKDELMRMNNAHCDAIYYPYGIAVYCKVENHNQSRSSSITLEKKFNENDSSSWMGYSKEHTSQTTNPKEFAIEDSQSYRKQNQNKLIHSIEKPENYRSNDNPKSLISTKNEGLNDDQNNNYIEESNTKFKKGDAKSAPKSFLAKFICYLKNENAKKYYLNLGNSEEKYEQFIDSINIYIKQRLDKNNKPRKEKKLLQKDIENFINGDKLRGEMFLEWRNTEAENEISLSKHLNKQNVEAHNKMLLKYEDLIKWKMGYIENQYYGLESIENLSYLNCALNLIGRIGLKVWEITKKNTKLINFLKNIENNYIPHHLKKYSDIIQNGEPTSCFAIDPDLINELNNSNPGLIPMDINKVLIPKDFSLFLHEFLNGIAGQSSYKIETFRYRSCENQNCNFLTNIFEALDWMGAYAYGSPKTSLETLLRKQYFGEKAQPGAECPICGWPCKEQYHNIKLKRGQIVMIKIHQEEYSSEIVFKEEYDLKSVFQINQELYRIITSKEKQNKEKEELAYNLFLEKQNTDFGLNFNLFQSPDHSMDRFLDPKLVLRGYISHKDSKHADAGHYISIIQMQKLSGEKFSCKKKDKKNLSWYEFDDQKVTEKGKSINGEITDKYIKMLIYEIR